MKHLYLQTAPVWLSLPHMRRPMLQWCCYLSGMLCVLWAAVDPRWRNAEGFLQAGFCLPISMGMALGILGTAIRSQWQTWASWLALACAGQAVALQLIDAGTRIHYQHYKLFSPLDTGPHFVLLGALALQTLLVTRGCTTYWSSLRAWQRRTVAAWQLLGVGLLYMLSSATVSPHLPTYLLELCFATFVQTVNLANVALLAWTFPTQALPRLQQCWARLFADTQQPYRGVDRVALLAALWVTTLAAVLSFFVYERHPHIPDEVIYLLHARYLAHGVLSMPAPPVPEAFDIYLMELANGRWFPAPPPGWPAVLALGVLCGVPWLVNPLLAGVNVLLAFLLVRHLYDRPMARLVVLLLCISPWHIFMAMNFMTHTLALTCALGAAVAVVQCRQHASAWWGGLGGLGIGMASLIRPLEGLVVAGLLGLWTLGMRDKRQKIRVLVTLCLGTLAVGVAVLPYNAHLTGKPTVFPLTAYIDKHYGPKRLALGFGPERGLGWPLDPYPGHGPLDAAVNANLNIFSLNTELLGWSTGSLLLIALAVFLGPLQRHDVSMLVVIGAIFVAHIFFWYSGGPDFGPRYWFLMLIPCLIFTVRGLHILSNRLTAPTATLATIEPRLIVVMSALCLLTIVNYLPWRAIDKYHHYLAMRPDVRSLATAYGFGKSLVLIRGQQRHPDYVSAATYNPLDLHSAAPVYAWDMNAEVRAQLLAAYPDRPVWIVHAPSLTQRGFTVVAGPLSHAELMATEPRQPE